MYILYVAASNRTYPSAEKSYIEELCINHLVFYKSENGLTQVFTMDSKPISCEFGEENIYTNTYIGDD